MKKNTEYRLNSKQRMFLESYLQTWNATEAARRAGYKHPLTQGPRLLTHPEIEAALKERIKTAAMEADEVLARLAEQAKLNAAEFFNFEENPQGELQMKDINWEVFRSRGHLVKRLTWIKGRPVVEFHDAQAALIQLGRALKLFTDGVDLNMPAANVHFYIPDNGRDDEPDQN
ncbi:terminase small subunit [Ornatilinea apprima]|uniref:terminase small subunit n=1 Tax=Ornatilinea apprima TaxID=1134406 RepID=UPI0009467DF4|nr:terminase small subunit [Ornatilinea apprima]